MHIGYVPRERPPFSALNFRSGAFSHIFPKSVPEHHHFKFWADFAVPETIIFKMRSGASPFYIFGGFCRSGDHHFQYLSNFSPYDGRQQPTRAPARRVLAVAESNIFTLKTAQARSGAPHFHAQNGSNSFRRPSFSRSTGSSFRSPCPFFFTLPRHIPTNIWVDETSLSEFWINYDVLKSPNFWSKIRVHNGITQKVLQLFSLWEQKSEQKSKKS